MTLPAPACEPCPHFGMSPMQGKIVELLLWAARHSGEFVKGMSLAMTLGFRADYIGHNAAVIMVKLRRHGWNMETRMGPGGGYRLVKLP